MNKRPIYNLKELDTALNSKAEKLNYVQILNSIKFNFKEIEHLCFWDADNYSKIGVGSGSDYELVLICWENNQQSPIEPIKNQKSYTYVLKGELTEDVFSESSEERISEESKVLQKRVVSKLETSHGKEHSLRNSNTGRTVSLHLYVK